MQFKSFGSAIGLSLLIAASAQAGWGSSGYYGYGSSGGYRASYYGSSGSYAYGSSGGSYGYGSSGYSSYYSSSGGSSGYHVGPIRRLAGAIHSHMAAKHARWHARRAYYGSSGYSSYGSSGGYAVTYRASYGSSGYSSGYGSSGGYSSSYGSSGGYTSSYGGSSGGSVSYGSTGGVYYGASTTSVSASSLLASSAKAQVNESVNLTVSVPTAAKIYVNGNPTTSTGAIRQFVSHGLQSGKEYRFKLRAELETAGGDTLTEEKDVIVGAGAFEHIAFAFDDAADAAIETAVTLNVPEGATVRLAGSDTAVTGSQRTYRTQRMKMGEVWDDYQIEVTHLGQTKRQSIRLIAGDQLEMTFNFDEDRSRIAMAD